MSLDSVPKINWESDDGVIFSDMNEIGANLQALEDSKYQETDELTTDTSNFVESNITTANIITLNVGAINPTSVSSGTQAISGGANWIPTIGFYVVGGNAFLVMQVNGVSTNALGGFFTDGSSVRIHNNDSNSHTATWIKL